MWVCAVLPTELNQQLTVICKQENRAIGLPENVFRFPLHISMKKSFQTSDFEKAKTDILQQLQAQNSICCYTDKVILRQQMLWLPVESAALRECHNRLDALLLERYAIPIDDFDAVFEPHISLFTKGSPSRIRKMQQILTEKIQPLQFTLNRFVIGSSQHADAFFEIDKLLRR